MINSMKDSKGILFTVGYELKTSQSNGSDSGDIVCNSIVGNTAFFNWLNKLEQGFCMTQVSMDTSSWGVYLERSQLEKKN